MGIKNFNQFLRKKCPEAFRDIAYSYFSGKRVAVDSDNILRKLMARSHKEIVNQTDVCSEEPDRKKIVERWLEHIKDELVKFLKYGITLIFVFDGAYIDEKSETQLKRREEKQKRIDEARDLKEKIFALDELERTPQMVTELRKKMHHLGTIKPEDKEMIIDILKNLGFPVLKATEEGEKLCSMLCIEGKVDAVYSRDTDVVAMGCPISFNEEAGWLYNTKTQKTELSLKCTIFKPILSALEMEYSTFLDLCIMSGCDFNDNIPKLGVGRSYDLLKIHKSIDNLPEKYDISILNHNNCRKIFKSQNSQDICQTEIVLNIDTSFIENNSIFEKYDIEYWFDDIYNLFKTLPNPTEIYIEKKPSYSSSKVKLNIIGKNIKPVPKASPKKLTPTIINVLNADQLRRHGKKINNF